MIYKEKKVRKKQIVFVNRFFYPDESATAAVLTDLISGLSLGAYDVTIVTGRSFYTKDAGKLEKRDSFGDAAVIRVSSLRVFNSSIFGRILNYIAFHILATLTVFRIVRRDDIVVCLTDPPLLSLTLSLPLAIRRAKLINWLQDIFPEVAVRLDFGGPLKALASLSKRPRNSIWRRSAKNVVIGERMRDLLSGNGVKEDQIAVIPNWCDETQIQPFAENDNPLRTEWGFSSNDLVVMYSGNLGRAHDTETVIDAMRILKSMDRSEIKFVFVGGGAKVQSLMELARTEDLDAVRFFDYQPRERLSESLSVADVHWISLIPELEGLIVPSKYYGICAVGRPSLFIGDADGELGVLLSDHECGWTVSQGDAAGLAQLLCALADAREQLEQAGANARKLAESENARAARIAQWQRLLESMAMANKAGE